MTDDQVWLFPNIAADDLPTHDYIVNACAEAGFLRNGVCIQVAGKPPLWVKYGSDYVMRSEGRTQAHVARIVNADSVNVVRVPDVHLGFSRGRQGYIVMDYVCGETIANRKSPTGNYTRKMSKLLLPPLSGSSTSQCRRTPPPAPLAAVLLATASSLHVEPRVLYGRTTPGTGKRGMLSTHYPYHALTLLANKVLRIQGQGFRVDFQTETANGLVLCPSDLRPSNFIIDDEERVWAIDFDSTCFLPPSFMSFSLTMSSDVFTQCVARRLQYPLSANLVAMYAASGLMVVCGNNALGYKAACV
ncbi:hypothetical protein EDD15DRAFT_2364241 [Pisolithus albus]|nr:hypothetical protein EDD15DRAFT_2364241 [Pisolithus albus]